MADLTSLLLATQDPSKRVAAEAQISSAEQASPDEYLKALAGELGNAQKPQVARQLAGLLLKNGLSSNRDAAKDRSLKERWAALPAPSRDFVKQATTSALIAPEHDVGKAAAQVLSKIGAIEIPSGQWLELVPLLLTHVTNNDPRARQIALVTLGYLCEDLVLIGEQSDQDVIPDEISNNILTAVVQGMRVEGDEASKLEATRAFYHAVVLAQKAFGRDVERNVIMGVLHDVCKQTASQPVQIAGFECLVQVATYYYDHIMAYMTQFGPLTWETIRTQSEKVGIPAMEFWSTICDEELELADMAAVGELGGRTQHNVIKQALQFLVPLLTEMLTRQESEDDDDTWNISMASGTCLGLLAQVVGDDCVDPVLAFVNTHFKNPDWKFREASVLAYGSIMEGPSTEKLRPAIADSFTTIGSAIQDPSVAVRDTCAWALGRIAQFHPEIMPVKQIVPVLGEKLADVPRVSANVCWVIQVLAESQPGYPSAPTTELSEFFPALTQALVQVTKRPDADERQLRMSAYNCLSVVVGHAGQDCQQYMGALVEEMLLHLQASYVNTDRECELQGFICGVLTGLVQRMRDSVAPAADKIMEEALKVIAAYQQAKGGAQAIKDEALLLIAALANALGEGFDKYMSFFAPHLKTGLENFQDTQVCLLATGMIGDLCSALKGRIIGYCDTILQILYANLQNPAVDRKIKAAIMTSFGDIALAVGGEFEKYLGPVVQMLQEASNTKLSDGNPKDEDWVDYLNTLREGVLEAYTGIVHGLREAGKLHLFKPHTNAILTFVQAITEDASVNESVVKAAVGVIGDLIFVFQQELTGHLQGAPFLHRLVEASQRSSDPSLQQSGAWLRSLLQKFGV